MVSPSGGGIGSPGTIYRRVEDRHWFNPTELSGSNFKGIADVDFLGWQHETGIAPATPILNGEVDIPIP